MSTSELNARGNLAVDPHPIQGEGWRMVLQKCRVSQHFSRISLVLQSHFFSGCVRLAVSFFIPRSLGVSIFYKAKGLEVLIMISLFVF